MTNVICACIHNGVARAYGAPRANGNRSLIYTFTEGASRAIVHHEWMKPVGRIANPTYIYTGGTTCLRRTNE